MMAKCVDQMRADVREYFTAENILNLCVYLTFLGLVGIALTFILPEDYENNRVFGPAFVAFVAALNVIATIVYGIAFGKRYVPYLGSPNINPRVVWVSAWLVIATIYGVKFCQAVHVLPLH